MEMSNITTMAEQNKNTDDGSELPAVCTHDFVKMKFYKKFRKCVICKTLKFWPWIKVMKCRNCKIVCHRKCLKEKPVATCDLSINNTEHVENTNDSVAVAYGTGDRNIETQGSRYSSNIGVNRLEVSGSDDGDKSTESPPYKIIDQAYFRDDEWYMMSTIVPNNNGNNNDLCDEYLVVTKSCHNNEEVVAKTIYLRLVAPTGLFGILTKIWQRPFLFRIESQ